MNFQYLKNIMFDDFSKNISRHVQKSLRKQGKRRFADNVLEKFADKSGTFGDLHF